jgi:hypothetical protein
MLTSWKELIVSTINSARLLNELGYKKTLNKILADILHTYVKNFIYEQETKNMFISPISSTQHPYPDFSVAVKY